MNYKKPLFIGVAVLAVLALLYAAAWQHDHPRWRSMPESLTRRDPSIDRSRIPLGPYTINAAGIIGGPVGPNLLALNVVFGTNDVRLQKDEDIGAALKPDELVTRLSMHYQPAGSASAKPMANGILIDGLRLIGRPKPGSLRFVIPGTADPTGSSITVICNVSIEAEKSIFAKHSFSGVTHSDCGSSFWPRPNIRVLLSFVPPTTMPQIATILPDFYRSLSDRIQGEQ